jgi:DNA-binding Lrp family transcriptional regulator
MENLIKKTGTQSQAIEEKKTGHKKHILHALYFNGPLSNSELSKLIKLSTPKINSLLMEMINDGLVKDLGRGDSSGGRRPNIYGLVDDGFYVAGITININRTIISIFNSNNQEVSGPHYFPIKMQSDLEIFRQVNEKLEQVVHESHIERNKILVAGIAHRKVGFFG